MRNKPSGDFPSEALIKETIEFWQTRGFTMSEDEAKEAILNTTGFFRVLAEWNQNDPDK